MENRLLDRIPLEAFRVFDAASRHMNFSRAGRELNITQAAVSRRIKTLEDHLGSPLFSRRGKNLELTPQGERLFQRVRASLDYLEESLEPFRGASGQTISIAASGSVSHLWLGTRLREFGKENPGISIRLLTTDSPSELASENNDLVILYSTGDHPRWSLTLLMAEELAPVASPDYLAARGLDAAELPPETIATLDLIDYDRFNAHWISFQKWFERIEPSRHGAKPRPKYTFSTYVMAIDAALRGDGVALGSLGLVREHLRDGRLAMLGQRSLASGYGYYLGLPRNRPSTDEVLRLHAALSRPA
ncbi:MULTISPECIES: LysR substrate-binding domain-containing protein [unclassified Sinorhizobium]|uniref:LysR substrate-binding domain-containing protein n=1 Tax=unclassified Sinorhizobium TaxID=2613772 RepID=UPI0024C463EF|nr:MULTISPECIES: LysR substrate-binding domain-containing protein [unclassified Sinorhizobium]MDK1377165.1 LysR substrate-binding domain-containing protein [Sinorhizobium sp. 6-70]MDK1478538.1 LysR substrate-binding domain-containing protein [Sinorhizobium sp. 6-117]